MLFGRRVPEKGRYDIYLWIRTWRIQVRHYLLLS